jgi:type VI protein secretion system component Hcp
MYLPLILLLSSTIGSVIMVDITNAIQIKNDNNMEQEGQQVSRSSIMKALVTGQQKKQEQELGPSPTQNSHVAATFTCLTTGGTVDTAMTNLMTYVQVFDFEIMASNNGALIVSSGVSLGASTFSPVRLTLDSGPATNHMMRMLLAGGSLDVSNHYRTVVITEIKLGGSTSSPVPYRKITLDTVFVTRVTVGGSGDSTSDRLDVELMTTKIYMEYSVADNFGVYRSVPPSFGWDFVNRRSWDGTASQ